MKECTKKLEARDELGNSYDLELDTLVKHSMPGLALENSEKSINKEVNNKYIDVLTYQKITLRDRE